MAGALDGACDAAAYGIKAGLPQSISVLDLELIELNGGNKGSKRPL